MANSRKTTKAEVQEPNQEPGGRSAFITIGNREVELVLTTRATRLIAARYGGLENLGETLETSENFEETLSEAIWLITLLANQSIQIHNLQNPADPQAELTEEEFELLTVPADLGAYREAIAEALYRGTRREVISETPKP